MFSSLSPLTLAVVVFSPEHSLPSFPLSLGLSVHLQWNIYSLFFFFIIALVFCVFPSFSFEQSHLSLNKSCVSLS